MKKLCVFVFALSLLVLAGCPSESGEATTIALETDNQLSAGERYQDYLQEKITENIVESFGCEDVDVSVEMTEEEVVNKVIIGSGEYQFSDNEKEIITKYILGMANDENVDIVFD
jgi:hypothetical protein